MSVLSISELSDAFRAKMVKPNPEPKCKGLIFRFARDTWMGTAQDINFRDRFRFIKGKSCTGCAQCDFLWEDLHENLCDPKFNYVSYDAEAHDQDQLYTLIVLPGTPDWETGYVEDWELEFRKYEEPKDDGNTEDNNVS